MNSLAPALLVLATTIVFAVAAASDDQVMNHGWIFLAIIICAAALWTPIHLLAYRQVNRARRDSPARTRLRLLPLPASDETDPSGDSPESGRGPAGFWTGTLHVRRADDQIAVPVQLALGNRPFQAAVIPVEADPGEPRVMTARLLEHDHLTDEMDLELEVAAGRRTESFEVHLALRDGLLLGGDAASEATVQLWPAAAVCSERFLVHPTDAEDSVGSPDE